MMKRVFITGASSGIGRAIAHALLARGDEVWGTSRNLERIPKMPRWHAVRLDLTDPLSIELELGNSRVHVVDLQPADIRTAFNQGVIKSTKTNPRYDIKVARTWEVVERNMKSAPGPDLVAQHVLRLVNADRPPPRITVGDAFQSKIAPLIFRFLPQRLRLWGLKRYYQI